MTPSALIAEQMKVHGIFKRSEIAELIEAAVVAERERCVAEKSSQMLSAIER